MAKLVFRKSLWKQDMLESGCSEQSLESYTWPDVIDNMEVGFHDTLFIGKIGVYIVLPEWCEIVEEVEQQQ